MQLDIEVVGWRIAKVVALLATLCAAVMMAGEASAQSQKVRIGTVPAYELNGPVWVAVRKGYFKEEGIDPELIYLGGPRTRDALASGDIDVGLISVVVGAIARQSGLPFKLIGLWYNAESFAVMVRSDDASKLNSIAALKGSRVVTPPTGSAAWAVGMAVFKKAGLDYRKDISVLHITDYAPQAFINLFERKNADVAVVWEPIQTVMLDREAAKVLVDLRKPGQSEKWLGGEVASMAMYTTEAAIAKKHDLIARVVRATARGHKFLTTASPKEIAELLAPDMKLDPATGLKVVESIAPGYGGEFGISKSRLQNDLAVYRGLGVLNRDIPVSELADFQFAGELP